MWRKGGTIERTRPHDFGALLYYFWQFEQYSMLFCIIYCFWLIFEFALRATALPLLG